MGSRRWLDRIGFLGVTSGVFLLGLFQGQYTIILRFEIAAIVLAVVFIQAVMASVTYTLFTLSTSGIFLWQMLRDTSGDEPTAAGPVTAIVPVYEDATVMGRSVQSLLESAYEDLSILLVVEPNDGVCRREAERLAEHPSVEYLVNTAKPGTKAGAINYAVDQTTSEYVAVFDADELVHPRFVPSAVGRLLDGGDVVQGRTVPQPDGWVESLAYAESVLLSYAARRFIYVFTGFRMAASRAVVMKRTAIESVGGYDEEMLTEDFAFAYTCYKARLDVRECLSYPSRIEAAHNPMDWWGQRKRWMTGYAQVMHKLLVDVRPLRDHRNVVSVLLCAATTSGSLLLLTFLSKFAVLLVTGHQLLFAIPLMTAIGVTMTFAVVDYQHGLIDRVTPAFLLVPLIIPFYSLAALKATSEYLLSWEGNWYSVEKGFEQ